MESHRTGRHTRGGRNKRIHLFRRFLAGAAVAACVLALWGIVSVLAREQSDPVPVLRTDQSLENRAEDSGEPAGEAPWYLRLVNPKTPLPRDFTLELTQVAGGQFDSRAADALSTMLSDMKSQGLSPLICSSFRTWEDQESLHQQEVELWLSKGLSQEEAEEEACRWVVPAGTSEHEVGLAVDLVSSDYQILDEGQESIPEQKWLMEHCWEYGFILRYPKDKTDLTGVGYEPWHYRYVGVEAAQEMAKTGQCLEEYWAAHFTQNGPYESDETE